MNTLLRIILSIMMLALVTTSCMRKGQPKVEDTPVLIQSDTVTVYQDADGNPIDGQTADQHIRRETQRVRVTDFRDNQRLRKYSVIIATLSKKNGVDKLKRSLSGDGVDHFVVQNNAGKYYFVVHSSDSEQEAINARAEFLLDNAVNKSKKEIWAKHEIHMTDTFILEQQ